MFTLIRNFKTINRYHKSLDAPELTLFLIGFVIFQVALPISGWNLVWFYSLNTMQSIVLGAVVGLVTVWAEDKVKDIAREAKEWLD